MSKDIIKNTFNKELCIELLCHQQKLLTDQGLKRFPQRSDFSTAEVVAIKAFLGPWPRALEAAGLKAAPATEQNQLKAEKRLRAKRLRTAALKEQRRRT